jgi:hypothetical protein
MRIAVFFILSDTIAGIPYLNQNNLYLFFIIVYYMNMTLRRYSNSELHIVLAVSLLIIASCMIPLENDGPQNQFHVAFASTVSDTVSPFGPLYLRFSRPVRDPDSASFVFTPVFTDFQILWNTLHDTATLYFASPLDPNAKYGIRSADMIESTDGAILSPGKDTLELYTQYCEQEPNSSIDLADILRGTLFGHVSTADDTDCFSVSDTAKRAFYLKSTGSDSYFSVIDANGQSITPEAFTSAETLSVPAGFEPPLHVFVYADNHSNGGSYELGWVKQK